MVHPTRADKYYVECANLDGQAYAAVGQLYQHSVAQDNTTKQSLNTIIFTAVVLLRYKDSIQSSGSLILITLYY